MCLDRWFNNNKEFKNKIIAELAKLKNKLSTTQQNIYDIYLTELQVKTRYNYYYASFSLEERLSNHPLYLHWQKILPEILTKPISSYFSDDEKIVLQTILGKDKADLFFLALDNLMDYPYQTNWYRRTLRSHQSHLYLSRMFDVLNEFLIYRNTQLTPLEKLKLSRKPIDENNLPLQDYIYLQSFGIYVLAAEIDNNNTQTIKLIEDIILGDNQVAFLSYGLINSIVKSHNQHLHKLLGDLLLAGRLQEGLRQSITENMDNGTVEAFLTLLKVIEENNLIRYASVKRAIATWTSLIDIDNADKITKKEISSFSKFLTNEQLRHQSLNSQNPVEIYLALWSYAFYNVETTIPFILDLFKNGQKHQKLVAGYFLNVINDNQIIFKLRYELVTQYNLTEDNLSLIAILFRLKLKDTAYKNFLDHNFSSTQLMDYYYKLKALSQNLPKEKIFSPCVFPWHTEILNLSDVLIEMADISYYLASDELLDDFCSEISRLDTFWRDNYLKKLYTTPKTLTQRQLVFCLLADRSEATRKESYNIINKLAISKDEYDLLISMLKYKYSDLRQNIIRLLLKQPEKQLLDTLKILLSDKKGSIRLAGLDILLQLQKNPHNQTLFNTAKSYLCTLTNPTTNEQILISQINDSYDNDPTIKELSYDTTLKTQLALSEVNNSLKIIERARTVARADRHDERVDHAQRCDERIQERDHLTFRIQANVRDLIERRDLAVRQTEAACTAVACKLHGADRALGIAREADADDEVALTDAQQLLVDLARGDLFDDSDVIEQELKIDRQKIRQRRGRAHTDDVDVLCRQDHIDRLIEVILINLVERGLKVIDVGTQHCFEYIVPVHGALSRLDALDRGQTVAHDLLQRFFHAGIAPIAEVGRKAHDGRLTHAGHFAEARRRHESRLIIVLENKLRDRPLPLRKGGEFMFQNRQYIHFHMFTLQIRIFCCYVAAYFYILSKCRVFCKSHLQLLREKLA